MKKIISCIFLLTVLADIAIACEVCERNRASLLKGFTHGADPESRWDYLIVSATVIIVLLSTFYFIKWIIRPGEKSESHIKRVVLNNECYE